MKTTNNRFFGAAMAAIFIAGLAAAPDAAGASEEGRRNTTLALGALTGYLFTRGGNKVPAFLSLGATAYAYSRYNDSISSRHRRERRAKARYYRNLRYRSAQARRYYYRY
jgi:hypothetical protein